MATYFDNADLIELRKAEKKILKTVIYHNWQNKFVADDPFEFLDKLELIFTDEQKLILSASEDKVPGIIVVLDFDAEKNKLLLLHQFGGKIDYKTENFTENPLWELCIGKELITIEIVNEGDNCFKSNVILLDFGDEKIEILLGIEGLIVEPFENV